MAILTQGIFKFISAAAAFLAAANPGAQSSAPLPETAPAPTPAPEPQLLLPAPPPPVTPQSMAEDFRVSFLQRVAAGRQTTYNTCFTRTGNPVLPANVDMVRNGTFVRKASYVPQEVDYTLPPIVVLDPGHLSEGDPGAIRNGLREAAVVNAVAVKLKAALEERGADVIGTRAPVADGINLTSLYRFKDQDRALQWRAELAYQLAAKTNRPVLAISLHADISESPNSKGAGIFYYAGTGAHSAPSAALARSIAASYRTPGGSKIKSENFAYLRCQKRETPAVLIELGYLTNEDDFSFLQSAVRNDSRAERIGDMLASGIFNFIDQKSREQTPLPRMVMATAGSPAKTF